MKSYGNYTGILWKSYVWVATLLDFRNVIQVVSGSVTSAASTYCLHPLCRSSINVRLWFSALLGSSDPSF